jgi:hypothetical protein
VCTPKTKWYRITFKCDPNPYKKSKIQHRSSPCVERHPQIALHKKEKKWGKGKNGGDGLEISKIKIFKKKLKRNGKKGVVEEWREARAACGNVGGHEQWWVAMNDGASRVGGRIGVQRRRKEMRGNGEM